VTDSQHPDTSDPQRTDQDLVCEYVLGVLSEDESYALELRARSDPALRVLIEREREVTTLAMLGALSARSGNGARIAPRPALRDRVLAAARAERFQSMPADRGLWMTVAGAPGVKQKTLYAPGLEGIRTSLVRAPSSSALGLLHAASDPAVFVVEGTLAIDGASYHAGDYIEPGDAERGRGETTSHCTLLLIERGAVARSSRRQSVRATEGGWRQLAAGTRMKPLAGGAGEHTDVMLLEMDPGGILPEHHHAGLEEIYLLRGDCVAQGQSLRVGDYHRAYEGTDHEETTTASGCLMLVIVRRAA
jgi:hypothetical protein